MNSPKWHATPHLVEFPSGGTRNGHLVTQLGKFLRENYGSRWFYEFYDADRHVAVIGFKKLNDAIEAKLKWKGAT
jgi:hypothetical protein